MVNELEGTPEPSLDVIVSRLDRCGLIIVEGYKSAPIPKIEARRSSALRLAALADKDPHFIAIAADHPVEGHGLPVFSLDDIAGIADFIADAVGVNAPRRVAATPVE